MKILNEIYKQLDRPDRTKEYFYVTDLGTCPRKVIMNFGSYEKKPQTNAEKIMFYKAENDHRAMARLLNKSDRFFIIREEFSINEGLPEMWHGRLDNLIYDKEDKSISPLDWKGTRSLKYQLELPKQSHISQLRSYLMALINMQFPTDKGYIIYTDRTGSYEGVEFIIEPDNDSVLTEMKIYEDWFENCIGETILSNKIRTTLDNRLDTLKLREEIMAENNLPPILDRSIKQIKNEFYLNPSWQCDYCYYQNLSCHPNMSKNKIAEIKDDKLKIRKEYLEYEDKLNEIINPKEYENTPNGFAKFVEGESRK